jgi:hypothetical protein
MAESPIAHLKLIALRRHQKTIQTRTPSNDSFDDVAEPDRLVETQKEILDAQQKTALAKRFVTAHKGVGVSEFRSHSPSDKPTFRT